MASDYDAPRSSPLEDAEDDLDPLTTARRRDAQSGAVDVDETADVVEVPVGEPLEDELTVAVVPIQEDEFRCDRCFLVHHRSQLATHHGSRQICRECA